LKARIIDKDNSSQGWFFAMNGASQINFTADQFAGTAALRNSNNAIVLNTWQHIAATWDGTTNGGNIHLYVNGAQVDSTTFQSGSGSALSDATTPVTIGNRQADLARGFSGAMDDVRVYNRVLSAAEIQNLAGNVLSVDINNVSSGIPITFAPAKVNQLLYSDRTYQVVSISAGLTGYLMLQTANNDKTVTSPTYLQFTVNRPATIYVCYAANKNALPNWLNDGTWTLTNEQFEETGTSTSRLVYSKTVPPGLVTLGGNLESPASNPPNYSNYVVIVAP
jgi:hypothetical protein